MLILEKNKKGNLVTFFLSIPLLLAGSGSSESSDQSQVESEEIKKKAEILGKKHLADSYKLDVVFTEAEVFPSFINTMVNLKGHVVNDPEKKVAIMYNYQTWELIESIRPVK